MCSYSHGKHWILFTPGGQYLRGACAECSRQLLPFLRDSSALLHQPPYIMINLKPSLSLVWAWHKQLLFCHIDFSVLADSEPGLSPPNRVSSLTRKFCNLIYSWSQACRWCQRGTVAIRWLSMHLIVFIQAGLWFLHSLQQIRYL